MSLCGLIVPYSWQVRQFVHTSLRKCITPVNPVQCHLSIELTVPYLRQVNIDLIAWRLGWGAQERSGAVPKRQNGFSCCWIKRPPGHRASPLSTEVTRRLFTCVLIEKLIGHMWELGRLVTFGLSPRLGEGDIGTSCGLPGSFLLMWVTS